MIPHNSHHSTRAPVVWYRTILITRRQTLNSLIIFLSPSIVPTRQGYCFTKMHVDFVRPAPYVLSGAKAQHLINTTTRRTSLVKRRRATMSDGAVVVKTRKFKRNPLLARRQVCRLAKPKVSSRRVASSRVGRCGKQCARARSVEVVNSSSWSY